MYPLYNNKPHSLFSHIFIDNLFDDDELKQIKEYCHKQPKYTPLVNNQNTNDIVRKSNISWIKNEESNDWFYKKYVNAVQQINYQYFLFDLNTQEPLQYTSYDEKDSHYVFHVDTVFNNPVLNTRKLSSILFLSDPNEYTGGKLIMKYSHEDFEVEQKYGRMIVFPSFIMHKVTPIEYGVRNSLVSWFSGPPIR